MNARVVKTKTVYNDVCKWTEDQCFRLFYIYWFASALSLLAILYCCCWLSLLTTPQA